MQQYTKWQSQTFDGSRYQGGSGDPYDVNVDVLPPDMIRSFAVSDVANPSVSLFLINGVERWYRGGVAFKPTFPMVFPLKDGSTLTIDRNTAASGDLNYTQQ